MESAHYEVEVEVPEDVNLHELSDGQLFGIVDSQIPEWYRDNCVGIEDRRFFEVEEIKE